MPSECLDIQTWRKTCLYARPVKSHRIVSKRLGVTLGALNISHSKFTPDWHWSLPRAPDINERKLVSVAYRNNCNYGHYMLIIMERGVGYLYDSGDCQRFTFYPRLIKMILRESGFDYGGTVQSRCGARSDALRDVRSCKCSIWSALVLHDFVKGGWAALRELFKLSRREAVAVRDFFHSVELDNGSLS